ncbi:phage terminase large subunit [Teichococcus deserti]|nr:phage terminase large subunit [Pseudoroseomonas deserti]
MTQLPALTQEQRKALLLLKKIDAEKANREATSSFHKWCEHLCRTLELGSPQPFHRIIIDALQQIVDGDLLYLMISMPPGYGKSKYVNEFFIPYWMMMRPRSKTIVATNAENLALSFSRQIRSHILEQNKLLGFSLETTNVREWTTTNHCEYLTRGAGSAINGRRGDLLIVDDPYADNDAAQKAETREKIWDWYTGSWISRNNGNKTAMIVVATRFHEEDLNGQLLKHEGHTGQIWDEATSNWRDAELEEPGIRGKWRYISLPAIAEENDPVGRQPGEALWPGKHTLADLAAIRKLKPRDFISTFQQKPAPEDGWIFDAKKIKTHPHAALPPVVTRIRAWDLAASLRGDWTVGVLMGRTETNDTVILDVVRFRGKPDEVRSRIIQVAEQDGTAVPISIPQDPGQAGASQAQDYARALAGYRLNQTRDTGDKETRAKPFASQVNMGNVWMLKAEWNDALIEELAVFPSGRHDDQVDALSRAFNDLMEQKNKPPVWRRFNLMGR